MTPPGPDHNLLFGILALQMDFISRDALVAAMNAWVLDKARPLGTILVAQGALAKDLHDVLQVMVAKHLEIHNNDPQQSLAALGAVGPVDGDLRQITDADVQASLCHVGHGSATPGLEATSAHVPPSTLPPHARFQILRPHARGGLGEVFVARDAELKREVALKEIQERHAHHPESRARFLLEAEVTGGLEHPGIVPVYGLGSYPDGRPFYAMRFIKGDSLKDAIAAFHQADRQGRSASERSLALRHLLGRFVDVCNAIAYAHSRGVLHRDLKPGNVMLGKYGETLVVDWGLAKVVGQADPETTNAGPISSGDTAMTQAGRALGTPAYMSPEQAAGRLDQLGPRSDTYSLGATLYCLLTGQAPFAESDVGAVLGKVQRGKFPPPRQVNPRVPLALQAVCLKAMALLPEDRYATPRELAEEIERWLADEPVQARREPLSARLGRWLRKHPALAAGAGALLLTGVIALAVSTLLIGSAQRKTADALRNEEQARKDRALAQVNRLCDAAPAAVPGILADLEANRDDVLPRLRELYAESRAGGTRTRLALALLPVEPEAVRDELMAWMLAAVDPAEVLLVRDALKTHAAGLKKRLWTQANDGAVPSRVRFRALVALAAFDPDSPRWTKAAPGLLDELLTANPLHLGAWARGLEPVRTRLLGPLGDVFRGKRLADQRQVAAIVLADFAADRPDVVAELLLDADAKQYAVLKPLRERHRERVATRMRRELTARPDYWKDGPLDPTWTDPSAALRREVEQAGGLFAERFALCQALPLERLAAVTAGLRPAGYRPVRVRTWSPAHRPGARGNAGGNGVAGKKVFVAVVWTRDGRAWELESGLTAEQVAARNDAARKAGLLPADVAAYRTKEGVRHTLLWRQADKAEQALVYVGVPASKHKERTDTYRAKGYVPATLQRLTGPHGTLYCSGIWWKGKVAPKVWTGSWDENQVTYDDRVFAGAELLVDVNVGPAGEPPSSRPFLLATLARARQALAASPDDLGAVWQGGVALFFLGEDAQALTDFNTVIEKRPDFAVAYRLRALLHARAGRPGPARRDLAVYTKRSTDREEALVTAALVDVHLGAEDGVRALAAAVKANLRNAGLLAAAAQVHGRAAGLARARRAAWVAGLAAAPGVIPLLAPQPPPGQAEQEARRAVALLEQAVQAGYVQVPNWRSDPDLEVLRDRSDFQELLAGAGALRGYASVRWDDASREARGLHGLTPEAHLERCRVVAAQGWRPVALALADVPAEKGPVAASAWHRPVPPLTQKEQLARRQASAGATLLNLGKPESVWPLYRHSPDPTVRSYLVQRAGMLGVDVGLLVKRLEEEPNVSARRALIVALGEYTAKDLPASMREPLVKKLLRWYRDDPDPGIHGAIDWLLRHSKEGAARRALDWGQRQELERIDRKLARRDPDGKRRWYINGQGQTLTLIEGPVEFRMGSPPAEPDRYPAGESPHRRVIARSFALATKTVTVAQWQRFLKERPDLRRNRIEFYTPGAEWPINQMSWYTAAQYCNWLSAKEKIPREQWCYPEKFSEGMKQYPDYLTRTGYRLPTEGEWEYACRAGAVSSRYFGSSADLLARYAWSGENSEGHTWPVGLKRPNDLGLFDTHGNVWNWCHGVVTGSIRQEDKEYFPSQPLRPMRGASFVDHAPGTRAATIRFNRGTDAYISFGLRVARTYR
jgi:formylglycine-generating enzyme required for sulfatase activity